MNSEYVESLKTEINVYFRSIYATEEDENKLWDKISEDADEEEYRVVLKKHFGKEIAQQIIDVAERSLSAKIWTQVKNQELETCSPEIIKNLLLAKKFEKATEIMANNFLKKEKIYTTRDDLKSEVWIYREGIYIPQAKTYIKEYVREMTGPGFNAFICNNVISKIEVDTYIEQDKFFVIQDFKKIAVQNGILDVIERKIYPFTPEMFFFNKLPLVYDENATCDNIKGFFKSILHDGDEKIMQEIFGYLLYRDYKFEKAFMFTGGGRNGKGKCVELMKRFIGGDNCINISLQRLERDNHAMCEFFMKMANLSADISSKALKETGDFKSLVGHDLITAPRKYLRPISFVNFAKMIFCANELPRTSDITVAFFNRWILIDFPYTFYSEKEIEGLDSKEKEWVKIADRSIIDKISTQEELNGLLIWALDGLHRLLDQDEFSFSKSTDQVKTTWLRKSDSSTAFCMDCLEENYNGRIQKNELRRVYVLYCRYNKLKPVSDKPLRESILTIFGAGESRPMVDGQKVSFWDGISFSEGTKKFLYDDKDKWVDRMDRMDSFSGA